MRGQLYADDLACGAGTPAGLQLLLDAVRAHGQEWGWAVNVSKTRVMVFGDAAARRCTADFMWGDIKLSRAATEKYLGLLMDECCTWEQQLQAAAAEGRAALYVWMRALRSPCLPAAAERLIDDRPQVRQRLFGGRLEIV